MSGKKKLPIGVDDFRDFISDDFYYVDKTIFIKKLLDNRGEVNLFARPRRFGKTLSMSTLKAFFETGDVINHCDRLLQIPDAEPDLYWENSSSNQLVRHFIDIADVAEQDDIERLIAGEALEKKLVMNLTYDELDKKELLWSVLYQTGYLTLDENSRSKLRGYVKFVIPNREIREIFIEKVQDWFAEKMAVPGRAGLYEEIWNGDAAALQTRLENILMDTISYYDYHENYYHALLVGLLLDGTCRVRSNYEMGKGRSDIVAEDGRNRRAAIIKTKRSARYEFLEEDARKAVEQVRERKYGWPYQRRGYRVTAFGISFSEKDCYVEAAELPCSDVGRRQRIENH